MEDGMPRLCGGGVGGCGHEDVEVEQRDDDGGDRTKTVDPAVAVGAPGWSRSVGNLLGHRSAA
jgi:hypothetical protein